jgi:hypothetical protein
VLAPETCIDLDRYPLLDFAAPRTRRVVQEAEGER